MNCRAINTEYPHVCLKVTKHNRQLFLDIYLDSSWLWCLDSTGWRLQCMASCGRWSPLPDSGHCPLSIIDSSYTTSPGFSLMDLRCVDDKYSDCGPSNNYTDNQAVAWDLTKAASCLQTLSLHTIPRIEWIHVLIDIHLHFTCSCSNLMRYESLQ